MRQRHLILSIILSFLGLLPLNSQITYVKSGASGAGTSWADASGNLQAMLNAATPGTQIWVAQGTYYPIQCNPCSHLEKDTPFSIPEGVALYGGFNGTETNLSQRNWEANPSILSGDIDQDGNNWNNSYTILYTRNVSSATLIDGFQVVKSYADNALYDVYTRVNSGGGLYNDGSLNGGDSQPRIKNCKFTDHYGRGFGAAIMNYGGFGGSASPEIYDCQFLNNTIAGSGGAVFNSGVFSGETSTAFVNCTFEANSANNGGAVYNQGSENGSSAVNFIDCHFENNSATVWGGAIVEFGNKGTCLPSYEGCTFISNSANLGGGILNDGSFGGTCNPVYTKCSWINNSSSLGGAGVYSQGPFGGESNPYFNECAFNDNITNGSGGALYFNGQDGNSNPKISNSTFTNNEALMYGGGMYNFGKTGHSNPIITNCLFIRNKGNAAGAIYNYGGVNGESSPTITNCTFFKNYANVGPCIYNQAADATGTVRPVVSNCIFWDNIAVSGFGLVFQNGHADPTIAHCIVPVADCASFNTDPNSTVTCGGNLLFNTDPLFMDPALENLRLQETSPALDYGNNISINSTGITVDLDQADRITSGTVDFGVYEYQSMVYQPPVVISQSGNTTHCEGDNKTLYVVTNGSPPLSYQWKKDGQTISGATDSTYIFLSLATTDAANYTCVVSSTTGDMVESNPIVLAVNPLLTVAITIEASATAICAGEAVIFDATASNGGSSGVYVWYLNGSPVGSNQSQWQTSTLAEGDEIHCILNSSETCTTGSLANSNNIQITVQNVLPIGVALTASQNNICSGEEVSFTASPQNPGINPIYTWYVNGQFLMTAGANIQLTTLNDGDEVTCQLESSLSCTSNNPALSDPVSIAVDAVLEAQIGVAASTTKICIGEEIVFEASATNGGNDPQYTWYINGAPVVASGSQLIRDNLQNGDQISCELTSSYSCLQQNPVLSDLVSIEVDAILDVLISIVASATEICEGEEVLLDAIPGNGGNEPEYIWLVNGIPTGSNAAQLLLVNPMDGDVISCLMVSSENCISEDTVASNEVQIIINENLEASIIIETQELSICENSEISITANAENEGLDPIYNWLINGVNQSGSEAVFLTSNLTDGDVVTCELTSSLTCLLQNPIISNSLIFAVQPLLKASLDIVVNDTSVCIGDTLLFDALAINAGNQPTFQWLLDGLTEIGNDASLSLDNLPEGESTISCLLTSSEECLEENPVTSNSIIVEVRDDISCSVATHQIPGIDQVLVFPNPASHGHFTLLLNGNHKGLEVVVRDIQGRLWYKEKAVAVNQSKQLILDLGPEARGIFYVQLTSAENRKVLKVLLF